MTKPERGRARLDRGRSRRAARSAASSVAVLRARSVADVSTAREMPEFSLSSETCMATIPSSSTPSDPDPRRLRSRRSTSGGRASRGTRSPPSGRVDGGRRRGGRAGAGRRAGRPARRRGAGATAALRSRPRRARRRRAPAVAVGGGRLSGTSSTAACGAARRRADFERGLSATSSGVGGDGAARDAAPPRACARSADRKSGGQMQPRARSAKKRFTRRSSSEWNEIAANRPPSRSRSHARGQRAVDLGELVVDGDPDRLEHAALGRMPAGKPRGRRHRARDRVDELEGGGESAPARGGRPISRAMRSA